MWIPAHRGIERNEAADALAKQALKHDIIMEVAFSKAESKVKIRNIIMKILQKQWDEGKKGCHLYNIKQEVGRMKSTGRHTREHTFISRLRLGHTGLNNTMHLLQFTIVPIQKTPKASCLNDWRPVALTPIISKCFEKLIRDHICSVLPASLDPLQFAYHNNRSTDDAIAFTLHSALSHLDKRNTYSGYGVFRPP